MYGTLPCKSSIELNTTLMKTKLIPGILLLLMAFIAMVASLAMVSLLAR